MKFYVLLNVSKVVIGQFGAIPSAGGLSIFSPFGLTDADVFGETGNDELADAIARYQTENAFQGEDSLLGFKGEDSLLGFQRFGPTRARLPPSIRVMDFVQNGQFDKEAFRRALKAALRKQEGEEAGASSEFLASTTPLTSTTSGFTTPGTTTTSTTVTTTPRKATRAIRRTKPAPPPIVKALKAPRARPSGNSPRPPQAGVRLAQGKLRYRILSKFAGRWDLTISVILNTVLVSIAQSKHYLPSPLTLMVLLIWKCTRNYDQK